jgi:hypothetical protein
VTPPGFNTDASVGTVIAVTWKAPGKAGRQAKHVQESVADFERRVAEARSNGHSALRTWCRFLPDGNVIPDFIPFDFDAKGNLPRAFADALKLLGVLVGFGALTLAIPFFFSGMKGIFVPVPAVFFNPEPAPFEVWKSRVVAIAESWKNRFGLSTLDLQSLRTEGLFRWPNTKHLDGNAWRIPVHWQELRLPPESIVELARKGPRDLELDPADTLAEYCPELAKDWFKCIEVVRIGHIGRGQSPDGETELPEFVPDRTQRLIEALGWRYEVVYDRKSGNQRARVKAIKLLGVCPACLSETISRPGAETGTAWITVITLRLKCFREKCPANSDAGDSLGGLAPEDWISRFAPEALAVLAAPAVRAPEIHSDRVSVEDLQPRLRAKLDEAHDWAAGGDARLAVVTIRPPGAGKSKEELNRFRERRGRGTFLTPSHALADEREAEYRAPSGMEATTATIPPTIRFIGALRQCVLEDRAKDKLRPLADSGWSLTATACPRCHLRDDCPVPKGARGRGLRIGTQAHAPILERMGELRDPVVLDEAPPLVDVLALEAADVLRRVTGEHARIELAEWASPRRDFADLLLGVPALLQAHHDQLVERAQKENSGERVYATRASGEPLQAFAVKAASNLILRRAGPGGIQATFGPSIDLAGEGALFLNAAITRFRVAANGAPPPDPPQIDVHDLPRSGLPLEVAAWPRRDTDRILLALADEIEGTLPIGVTACMAATGEGKKPPPILIEVRRRTGLIWDEAEAARQTKLESSTSRLRALEAGRRPVYAEALSRGGNSITAQSGKKVATSSVKAARRRLAKDLRELRRRRGGPCRSLIVLDATAHWAKDITWKAFKSREVKHFDLEAYRPGVEIHRIFLLTKGTFRSKLISDQGRGNWLSGDGATLVTRLIRKAVQSARITTDKGKVKLGIIAHMVVAEVIRAAFTASRGETADERAAASRVAIEARGGPVLEAFNELREVLPSVEIGYFGGERGSNKYVDCDALLVIGSPIPNLDGAAENARTLGVNPEIYIQCMLQAEIEQSFGRIRVLWVKGPRVILHAANVAAVAWKDEEHHVVAVPEGGPIPSAPSEDLALALHFQAKQMGLVCVDLLNFLAEDPARLELMKVSCNSILKEVLLIRSWSRLSQDAMRQVLERSFGRFLRVSVPRPHGSGYWSVREVRPGAAQELRRVIETMRAVASSRTTRRGIPHDEADAASSPSPLLARPNLIRAWKEYIRIFQPIFSQLPLTHRQRESIHERAGMLLAAGEDPLVAELVAWAIELGVPATASLDWARDLVRLTAPAALPPKSEPQAPPAAASDGRSA